MNSTILGALHDAVDGPIGSKRWLESRWSRIVGADRELTPDEKDELLNRLREKTRKVELPAPRPRPALFSTGEIALSGDSLHAISDADESDYCEIDEAEQVRRIREAEKVYQAICSDECGVVIDPELMAKKMKERAALRAQSHAIARKLELAKVKAYRSDKWTLWVYGIHSGEVEVVPQFRRVAFIPYVAAAIREPFVRELEHFLQTHLWCRFWTFSNGPRCRLCELRREIKRLHRRISKLNDLPFMKEAGVRIVFRSTELGTIETTRKNGQLDPDSGAIERDEKGELWFHPHAHCCVEMEKGRLEKAAWSALLEKVWKHWGDHWDDGGTIRSVRECVKYVTKPTEVQHLSPAETSALFEALSRCKLVQPMGRLADEMKAREEAGRTLVRQRTDDGFVWVEVFNWNKRASSSEEKVRQPGAPMPADFVGPPDVVELSERDMLAGAKLGQNSDPDCCVVVARCTPAACSLGIKEPRVVVMGQRWNADRVNAHPLVDRLWQATYDQWHAGLSLIRVHTGTPTVRQTRPMRFLADMPERAEPPGPPVFSV